MIRKRSVHSGIMGSLIGWMSFQISLIGTTCFQMTFCASECLIPPIIDAWSHPKGPRHQECARVVPEMLRVPLPRPPSCPVSRARPTGPPMLPRAKAVVRATDGDLLRAVVTDRVRIGVALPFKFGLAAVIPLIAQAVEFGPEEVLIVHWLGVASATIPASRSSTACMGPSG